MPRTPSDGIATAVALAAVIALGLSAGALLMEGAVLVSYWRSLPAADFLSWYRDNASRLLNFFGPLEIVTAVLVLAAAGLYAARRRWGGGLLAIAALLTVAILAAYPLYFRDVNASFAAATIAPDAVPAELARWAFWHWVRFAIAIAALAAGLAAVRHRGA